MKFRADELRRIVEQTDWDNELIRQDSKIDAACVAVVAVAAMYFAYVILGMYLR
jgi:hypothetical protein